MSDLRRRAGAIVSTTLMLLALSALTRLPWRSDGSGDALLRLSWRARGEIVERCRRSTPEELARTPAHMRQEVVCEPGQVAPYTLEVRVNGRTQASERVRGSGEAGEGMLYVLHEWTLTPGSHRVEVRFRRERDDSVTARDEARRDDEEEDEADDRDRDDSPRGRRRHVVSPLLVLDTTITLPAGRIALVTYAAEEERLVVVGANGPPGARQP